MSLITVDVKKGFSSTFTKTVVFKFLDREVISQFPIKSVLDFEELCINKARKSVDVYLDDYEPTIKDLETFIDNSLISSILEQTVVKGIIYVSCKTNFEHEETEIEFVFENEKSYLESVVTV